MSQLEPLIEHETFLETWPTVRPFRLKGLDKEWLEQFPLRTEGRLILNKQGERFRLRGVNWYGASDVRHIVGGLDVQSLDVICETVHELGFSVVRLPFSNEMLRCGVPEEGAIDYKKNPALRGCTAMQVFDEVIRALGRHKIAVIVNNHTTYGEFCGPPSRNSLWFDPYGPFSEEQWQQDWLMVARRYSQCAHVVGFDLRNEIRPRKSFWPNFEGAEPGGAEAATGTVNWARASRCIADLLHQVNPNALIVVERIVWPQGGLLHMAADPGPLLPALAGRLVLGAHMYSWSGPGRFVPRWSQPPGFDWFFSFLRWLGVIARSNYGDMSSEELEAQFREEVGCVLEANLCPVWISEFGADLQNPDEMEWLQKFVGVLETFDADWAYWPLNVGLKPGTGEGADDLSGGDESYGMLGPDWRPKRDGDYRIDLMEAIGLNPPAGLRKRSSMPQLPAQPLDRVQSRQSARTLFGKDKDPLFALKSAPDVKEVLWSFAPRPKKLDAQIRRVQTASATMSMSDELSRAWTLRMNTGMKRVQSAGQAVLPTIVDEEERIGA